jgi:hypothetical protein
MEPLVTPTVVAGKAKAVGKKLMPCAADCAVPCSGTFCGLPVALSVNVSVPSRIPLVAGLKTTETVHVAPAASEDPQVLLEIEKSPGSLPPMATLLIVTAVVPVFLTVVVNAALELPVVVTGNVNEDGVKVNVVAARTMVVAAQSPASVTVHRSAVRAACIFILETPELNLGNRCKQAW